MRKTLLVIIACVLLAGCSRDSGWHANDVSGLVPDLALDLTDESGRHVTAQSFRGHTTLLYFGYTHCPDVCPTTLAQLADALAATKDRGVDARVLFVTVDPARDTEDHLREYVRAFGPQFVGLRGDTRALDALTRRYRVTYSLGPRDARGDYAVTHSSAVFVFDGAGHARLLITPQTDARAITADLDRLAAAS